LNTAEKHRKEETFLIYINDVTKIYENNAKGVTRISLEIEKGEFAFIVGSSGSGKSTLIRLMLKEIEPTHGDIVINDTSLRSLARRGVPYFRRRMGVVFQDFRLLPNKTVYENVAFAMQVVQSSHREIRRNVPAVLAMVGLQKKAKAYPNQLSGGEQQRASLARAIVNKPALLLADEPTGNLDPETAWEIMTLLEDINETGTTTVVATHAKEIVDQMKKRVITLRNGTIARDIEKGGYNDEV
jgi:cell division transport system ATP-binding protein